jgi:hypothetical protein
MSQINANQIQPLTMPDGAPIAFASGDVRHFQGSDAMSAVSISNPTRMLAYRDNLLRDTLNQVVGAVNNTNPWAATGAQLVSIPVLRVVLSPTQQEPIANFRIPLNMQASVINAAVASFPGGLGQLTIWFNPGFGGTVGGNNGVQVLQTNSETASGYVSSLFPPAVSTTTVAGVTTSAAGGGEFIVQLTNVGTSTGEFTGSILVALQLSPVYTVTT